MPFCETRSSTAFIMQSLAILVVAALFCPSPSNSLSLEQIHGGLSSSESQQRRDKSVRDALDLILRPRHPGIWLPDSLLLPARKRQLEQVVNIPLDQYEEDASEPAQYAVIRNAQDSEQSHKLAASLARKISNILARSSPGRPYILRKRALVKRNGKAYSHPKSTIDQVKDALREDKNKDHQAHISHSASHPTSTARPVSNLTAHSSLPVEKRIKKKKKPAAKSNEKVKEVKTTLATPAATTTAISTTSSISSTKTPKVLRKLPKPTPKLTKAPARKAKAVKARTNSTNSLLKSDLNIIRSVKAKKFLVKRYARRPNDDDEEVVGDEDILQDGLVSADTPAEEPLEGWLRKEYYRNLARTLATLRKKRRTKDEIDNFEQENENRDDAELANAAEEEQQAADIGSDSARVYAVEGGDDTKDNVAEAVVVGELVEQDPLRISPEDVLNEIDTDYLVAVTPGEQEVEEDDQEPVEMIVDDNALQASRKRKRSAPSFFGKIDENVANQQNYELDQFQDIDAKLERIEEALLTDAISVISDTVSNGEHSSRDDEKVANRFDAAYDLEDMRLALGDLRKTMSRIENEQESTDLIDGNYVEGLSGAARSSNDRVCPALAILTSNCNAIRQTGASVPFSGQLRDEYTEPCNWHEVCYTCGEEHGLMASDCDSGFLELSRLACQDSPTCEVGARLMLEPLRQVRVFYKRRVPDLCLQSKCVGEYLALGAALQEVSDRKR